MVGTGEASPILTTTLVFVRGYLSPFYPGTPRRKPGSNRSDDLIRTGLAENCTMLRVVPAILHRSIDIVPTVAPISDQVSDSLGSRIESVRIVA